MLSCRRREEASEGDEKGDAKLVELYSKYGTAQARGQSE
jgi:hypothetical protein